MEKQRRNVLCCALALASLASCGGLSGGRSISAFYAQTGKWSWLGIGISSIAYGLLMTGILRLKRKTGANCLPGVYAGIFGRRGGAAFTALHAAFYALAAYTLLYAAAEAAELVLPFRNADIAGTFSALMLSLWISLRSNGGVRKMGCICYAIFAAVMLALAVFGKFPGKNVLHFYVELRLENGPWAEVLLALVHASLAAGICAAAAVRLFPAYVKPGAAGLTTAGTFCVLMIIGNCVFSAFPKEINALKYPFVALSAGLGAAGFYIFALMRWLESTVCLCGILCLLPVQKG